MTFFPTVVSLILVLGGFFEITLSLPQSNHLFIPAFQVRGTAGGIFETTLCLPKSIHLFNPDFQVFDTAGGFGRLFGSSFGLVESLIDDSLDLW